MRCRCRRRLIHRHVGAGRREYPAMAAVLFQRRPPYAVQMSVTKKDKPSRARDAVRRRVTQDGASRQRRQVGEKRKMPSGSGA